MKGANPNQFMMYSYGYPETCNLFIAYMEIKNLQELKDNKTCDKSTIYCYYLLMI